ncbi:MAG: DUF2268 domain-containing protein [Bryobacteraceae bacterium]|nr:DUF2268 domain-containing protein [Bryobacteraceae bacterium]
MSVSSRVFISLLALWLTTVTLGQPATELSRDPARAPVSVSDVALFWRAYDAWTESGAANDRLAATLQTEYLDKASEGVKDFTPNRIESAASLAAKILEDRAYYERARPYAEKIAVLEPEIRTLYRRFREWYPDARFPALYFVVGRRNSGGMSSPRALIIGAEMFGDEKARLRFDVMVPMVAHELMHFQQQTSEEKGSGFLASCIREGSADFLAERLAGRHINESIKSYGDSHERELWERFQVDLKRKDGHRGWLYNGRDPNRVGPPDLGYYMGYKITQAFYQAAADPAEALRTIIEMRDPEVILKESRYAERFGRPEK